MLENLLASSALPNLHPALVHFPLALLPLAVVCDAVAVLSARRWFDRAAVALYGLGAGLGWWAAEVGEEAADAFVNLPPMLEPEIASHSDKAHYALYVLAAVFVFRLGLLIRDRSVERLRARGVRAGVLVIAGVGLFLLVRAGESGAALVYRHGLGVSPAAVLFEREDASAAPAVLDRAPAVAGPIENRNDPADQLIRGEDGTLFWAPQRRDAGALGSILFPLTGFASGAVGTVEGASPNDPEPGVDFEVLDRGMLVFAPEFGDVKIEAELALEGFEGTVGLVHHATSAEVASWFEIATAGGVALRLSAEGAIETLEASELSILPEAVSERGTVRLGVSSVGRHRKGMVNGEVVAHGHTAAPPAPGKVGLLFDGRGEVRVLKVTAWPL